MFIHINKLQPPVRERMGEVLRVESTKGVGMNFRDSWHLFLTTTSLRRRPKFLIRGKVMGEEWRELPYKFRIHFRFLKHCFLYAIYTRAFSHPSGISLKRWFSFLFSAIEDSSTGPKYINCIHSLPRYAEVSSPAPPLVLSVCSNSVSYFQLNVIAGTQRYKAQFTFTFCKAPEGDLGRFLFPGLLFETGWSEGVS